MNYTSDHTIIENIDGFDVKWLTVTTDEDGDEEEEVTSTFFRKSNGWTRNLIEEALDRLNVSRPL